VRLQPLARRGRHLVRHAAVVGLSAIGFGAGGGPVLAQPAASQSLQPGLWQASTQIWFDGQEVLRALDDATRKTTEQIVLDLRSRMTAQERAEFDRTLPPRESLVTDTECITPEDARMSPQDQLRTALQAIHEPPWACSFSGERRGPGGFSFDYRCRTPADAQARGTARFEGGGRFYRMAIDGTGQWTDQQTGKPLDSRVMNVRSLTVGRWLAPRCGS
jgi:hypothetical protein